MIFIIISIVIAVGFYRCGYTIGYNDGWNLKVKEYQDK